MAVNLSPIWGAGAQLLDNSGNVLSGGKIYTYAAGTTTQVATYTSNSGLTANSNPIVLNSAGRVPYEIWLTDGQNYKFVLKDSNDVLIGTWDNLSGINSNFIAYTNQQEIQTATAGQTVFNLTTMNYLVGTNSLSVFVDGVNQYGPGAQYAYEETDSNTVTFASGLHVGAEVKFTSTQIQNAGAVDASQVSFTGFNGQEGSVQDLAGNDGSDWIGFTQSGTGAVAISSQEKSQQWVSPKDFGATGNGTTDDGAALTASETAYPANLFNGADSTYKITSNLVAGFRMINGEIYDTRTVNPTDPYSVVGIGQNVLTANTFIPEQHSSSYPAPYTYWASGNHLVAIGYNALAANTTGRRNTAIGSQTMATSTTAYYNTAVGSHSLQKLTTGHENVAMGVQALNSVTSGTGNTGLGTTAGTNITTGTNNSFGGNLAGTYCTTGNSNTGFGYRAGFSITTADDVTAFGRDSLVSCTTGIQNTAVGAAAAQNVVASQNNTAMGWSALRNADSNYNSAFGALSLYAATSGDKNTAVGNYSGWELTTGSNNLLLGYYAGGSSSPSGSLTTQSNRICLGDNNITNAYINVSWTVVSDERDKTEIKDIPYGLDFVSKLKPIQYKLDNRSRYWIQNEDGTVDKSVTSDGSKADEKPSFGFKAQDVIALEKEINGNCVIGDDSDDELLKVTDARFIPVLVKAIQELKAEIDALKAK